MIKTIENYKDKLVEKIIISKDVKFIKKDAFKGCNLLKEIYFEDGNDCIKIEEGAFPEPSIKYLRLSNRLDDKTNEELSSIFNIENLKTVSFSNKVENIHCFFFNEDIEYYALRNNHEEMILEPGRTDGYFTENGVWYFGRELCLYPQGKKDKTYYILDGTTESSFRSIYCNRFIERIVFPESFEFEYTDIVVDNCPNLKTIEIKGKNKEIYNLFFDRCDNLKYIISDPSNKFNNEVYDFTDEKVKVLSSEEDIYEKEYSFKEINSFFKENER